MQHNEQASIGGSPFRETLRAKFGESAFVAALAALLSCLLLFVSLIKDSASPSPTASESAVLRKVETQIRELRTKIALVSDQISQERNQKSTASGGPGEANGESSALQAQLALLIDQATQAAEQQIASSALVDEAKTEIGQLQTQMTAIADQIGEGREREAGERKDVDEALDKAREHLVNKRFALAYDLLMVASRLSASDPRLFDAILGFVEEAKDSQDDEAVTLAEELLGRGDSLVYFQSPMSVESARSRLVEAREGFPAHEVEEEPVQPETRSESIQRLIETVGNEALAPEVRIRVAERARAALDDAWLDSILSTDHPDEEGSPDHIKQLEAKLEGAEKRCVAELYMRHQAPAEAWLKSSQAFAKQNANVSDKEWGKAWQEIDQYISRGMDCLQEIAPFAKSEVAEAAKLSSRVEKELRYLHRLKLWLNSQQTLRTILWAEDKTNKSIDSMDKLKALVRFDEELLSPYVKQRYEESWKKFFDSLGDEEKKLEASQLRIFRVVE